jgi:hypothetical protein
MSVEIRRRERLSNGWVRFYGVVNGVAKVGKDDVAVRIPAAYVESVSSREADQEVKEALQDEYERLTLGAGSVFVR